jgi:hypothetical protein
MSQASSFNEDMGVDTVPAGDIRAFVEEGAFEIDFHFSINIRPSFHRSPIKRPPIIFGGARILLSQSNINDDRRRSNFVFSPFITTQNLNVNETITLSNVCITLRLFDHNQYVISDLISENTFFVKTLLLKA